MEAPNTIKKQIEFYFSDANLRVDTFLKNEIKKNDGWVDASVLLTFNKMKLLGADLDSVRASLKGSNIVELKEDENDLKLYIKKIETEAYTAYINDKNIDKRILFVKGFKEDATFEEIEEYLGKHFEFVLLRMVRNKEKAFVGAVFVELKNDEDVDSALKMEIPILESSEVVKKRKVEGKDGINNFLLIKRKTDYTKENKTKKEDEKKEEQKKIILDDFKGKFYKYECNKTSDVKNIKDAVEDAAFVDLKEQIIRFKKIMDFDEKEYEKDELKIKVRKLKEEEAEEYSKNIKFTTLGAPKRRRKTNK